jgi:hypothetical protein
MYPPRNSPTVTERFQKLWPKPQQVGRRLGFPPRRVGGEVAEALSAKIARLESEDQQAVVTELRTHEQGLGGE